MRSATEVSDQGDDTLSRDAEGSQVMKQQLARRRDEFANQIAQSYVDLGAVASLPAPTTKSMLLLPVENKLRSLCIRTYTTTLFAQVILLVIVLNSILMLVTYSASCEERPCLQHIAQWIDLIFTFFFTAELIIKVIALGFLLHPQAYLRNGWNILDFVIVVSSIISLTGILNNVSFLRILRPLRTMSRVPGLKNLMGALFAAVPEIRDNVILILFIVILFAILGVQLFSGVLHQRCYVTQLDFNHPAVQGKNITLPHLIHTVGDPCGGSFKCSSIDPAVYYPALPEHVECKVYKHIHEEAPLSFDNLPVAVLLVFKIVSGDDWPEDMLNVMNASSSYAAFYFLFCFTVGGLFATNLFLAVLINAYYTHAKKADIDEDEALRAKAAWLRLAPEKEARRGSMVSGMQVIDKVMASEAPSSAAAAGSPSETGLALDDNTNNPKGSSPQHSGNSARRGSRGSHAGPQGKEMVSDNTEERGAVHMPGEVPDSMSCNDVGQQGGRDGHAPHRADSDRDSTASGREHDSAEVKEACKELRYKHLPPPTAAFDAHPETNQQVGSSGNRGSNAVLESTQRSSHSNRTDCVSSHSAGQSKPSGTPDDSLRQSDSRVVGFVGGDHAKRPSSRERSPQKGSAPSGPDPVAAGAVPEAEAAATTPDDEGVEEALPPNAFRRLRQKVEDFVLHAYIESFILSVTGVNVVALATDHHNISPQWETSLEYIGLVCTVIFTIEIILKLFGMGPIRCLRDLYNAFDAFLVAISLPDLFTGGSSAFSAFRAFRMMRAVRILRRWPSVHNLLKALMGCLNEGMYVAILLLLQIFIFAILGMQLFQGKLKEDFRMNYNTMWEAAITSFIVITGDAWAKVMKEGIQARGVIGAFYFLTLFVIGNFVLVNVVVAVILDKLDDNMGNDVEDDDSVADAESTEKLENPDVIASRLQINVGEADTKGPEGGKQGAGESGVVAKSEVPHSEGAWSGSHTNPNEPKHFMGALCYVYPFELKHKSLHIFAVDNKARVMMAKVLHSNVFDLFIAAAIAANVVFLGLERERQSDEIASVLEVTNYVFTIIFFLEMCLKIFVLGLVFPHGPYERNEVRPYLRDPWNRVDCVVVLLAATGLAYKPMSAFRSLRTLRLIIRSSQLRLVISAMLSTLPSITQGVVVCGFVWFVFGILGTQLFKGSFYACTDPDVHTRQQCIHDFIVHRPTTWGEVIEVHKRDWQREPDHFDNILWSIYTLFAVAVGEGWGSVMYRGIDARNADQGPERGHNPLAALFFVVFHVVGNFFCVNLIVGILINNFTENRKKMTASDMLTDRQRKYAETDINFLKKFLALKDKDPTEPAVRKYFFIIAKNANFERLITFVIIANMAILATQHHDQAPVWDDVQFIGNTVCTALFIIEAGIKIIGLYPRAYFQVAWNRFDFVIVLMSVIGMCMPRNSASVMRVLPTGRLFRLVHLAKGLQKLFNTITEGHNLAYFASVGVLCLACFFMFGVAGVSMFGSLERTHGLNQNLNFENVPNAMLTLFTLSTTEGWLDVRNGLTNTIGCGQEGQRTCGSMYANIYMFAFIVVGAFMMMNLFAAVVVELFEAQEAQEQRAQEIQAMYTMKERWEMVFKQRRAISCLEFLAAMYPMQKKHGLFPSRLFRVPQKPRPTDSMEALNVACISLTTNPPDRLLCAYLLALDLPIHIDSAGEATVLYDDLVNVALAKVFCMQETDVNCVISRGFAKSYPAEPGPRIGHWFAGMLWAKRKWYKYLDDLPPTAVATT